MKKLRKKKKHFLFALPSGNVANQKLAPIEEEEKNTHNQAKKNKWW